MRIYKCNRCGTTFNTQGNYVMLRKAYQTASADTPPVYTTTPAAWIDLCPTCTESFLTWLHPTQSKAGEDNE